jgi:hypothetical protein
MMAAICASETSINFYQTTQRYISERSTFCEVTVIVIFVLLTVNEITFPDGQRLHISRPIINAVLSTVFDSIAESQG